MKTTYETKLRYLVYDGTSNYISIPIDIRERHLTQDTESAVIQTTGTYLLITIPSERDSIEIRLPLEEWHTSESYGRRFSGANNGLINVGRFESAIGDPTIDEMSSEVRAKVSVIDHTPDDILL